MGKGIFSRRQPVFFYYITVIIIGVVEELPGFWKVWDVEEELKVRSKSFVKWDAKVAFSFINFIFSSDQ